VTQSSAIEAPTIEAPAVEADVVDVDVAAVAVIIGDPTRCRMLHALIDGTERPAGELAHAGGVSPATASAHLRQLVDAGLLTVRACGRHRYYALSGPQVAAVLEALAAIAPSIPVRSLRQSRAAREMAEARSCYDHLAGRAGVSLRESLLSGGALVAHGPKDYRLTPRGRTLLADLGIDPGPLEHARRGFAHDCLDWTQRRPLSAIMKFPRSEGFSIT